MIRNLWVLAIGVIATGCHPAAAVLAIPAIEHAVEREQGRRATDVSNLPPNGQLKLDIQKGWRRQWQTLDGKALSADKYKEGEVVVVIWNIPFGTAKQTGGVAAFTEASCQASLPEPVAVRATFGADARVKPEVWHTGVGPGQQLSYMGALRLFGSKSQMRDFPKWLIITPKEGDYNLQMVWQDTSILKLQTLRPCIQTWAAVEMGTALGATDIGEIHTTQAPKGAEVSPTRTPMSREEKIEATKMLALSGDEKVDLPKLHDLALDAEFGGVSIDEYIQALAQKERQEILERLLKDSEGKQALCQMVAKYRLDERGMKLWDEKPTVEKWAMDKGGCRRSPGRLKGP